jgi:hypothetical protein
MKPLTDRLRNSLQKSVFTFLKFILLVAVSEALRWELETILLLISIYYSGFQGTGFDSTV